jgi:hypothetical protein
MLILINALNVECGPCIPGAGDAHGQVYLFQASPTEGAAFEANTDAPGPMQKRIA